MALGAIRRIQDAGLSIPQDIAVIGFDGLQSRNRTTPSHDVAATSFRYRLEGCRNVASDPS